MTSPSDAYHCALWCILGAKGCGSWRLQGIWNGRTTRVRRCIGVPRIWWCISRERQTVSARNRVDAAVRRLGLVPVRRSCLVTGPRRRAYRAGCRSPGEPALVSGVKPWSLLVAEPLPAPPAGGLSWAARGTVRTGVEGADPTRPLAAVPPRVPRLWRHPHDARGSCSCRRLRMAPGDFGAGILIGMLARS